MKTFVACLFIFSAALQSAEPLKTDALKLKYEEAKAKALEPITKVYVAELKKLLQEVSRKGDLREVEAVTAELRVVAGEAAPGDTSPAATVASEFKSQMNKLIKNAWTWETARGKSTVRFDKDGNVNHSVFTGKYTFKTENTIMVENTKQQYVLAFDFKKGEYSGYAVVENQEITGHEIKE